jgi:hypothetical protein
LGGGQTAQGVSYPGGLDLTTPSLRLQPGALRDALNFEVAQFGGYARTEGYERVDGRASPSAATYIIVQMANGFINVPLVGQIVTQDVSGATGTIIGVVNPPAAIGGPSDFTTDFSSDFGGGAGLVSPAYLVLTMVHGVFDNTNLLNAYDVAVYGLSVYGGSVYT